MWPCIIGNLQLWPNASGCLGDDKTYLMQPSVVIGFVVCIVPTESDCGSYDCIPCLVCVVDKMNGIIEWIPLVRQCSDEDDEDCGRHCD